MELKKIILTSLPVLLFFAWIMGCDGKRPLSPSRVISLNVAIPPTGELHAALLNASSNEILYRVDGPGMMPIKNTIGPFSTAATSGSVDFSLQIPGGNKRVLSVQINDASTHQPLAIGAARIDFSSASPVTDVVVEMGSVTRTCYYTYGTSFSGNYSFAIDATSTTSVAFWDMSYNTPAGVGGPVTITDPNASPVSSIAYMGNGNFVDYDYLPPDGAFNTTSAMAKLSGPISIGDIFCLKLQTIPSAHAWIQITNPGSGTLYQGPFFRFRVNSTLPFYSYEQTPPDINGTCSTFN